MADRAVMAARTAERSVGLRFVGIRDGDPLSGGRVRKTSTREATAVRSPKAMAKVLTQYSSHANMIADTFRAAFAQTRLGECTVDMTAPEESTRGGLLGLQHATFRTPSGMAIVVGTVHAGDRKAEFRAYSLVSSVHEERFKRPPPFAEADYAAFLSKAQPVLAAFGLEVSVTATLEQAPQKAAPVVAAEAPKASQFRMVLWLSLIALVVVVSGALFWSMRWAAQ